MLGFRSRKILNDVMSNFAYPVPIPNGYGENRRMVDYAEAPAPIAFPNRSQGNGQREVYELKHKTYQIERVA